MLTRHFLIGVIALATLPSSTAQQAAEPPARVLLAPARLSDDVAVLSTTAYSEVNGRPAFIEVRVHGQYGKGSPKRLSIQEIQAWLLRVDGTAVAAMPKSFHDRPSLGDIDPNIVFFDFVPVPARELVGVVVGVNGTLYVREIKAS